MHFVTAKGILSRYNGMNVYRGCTHGCIYCDSRSKCYHIEHVFEDIEVKQNAPELLERALSRKRQKCVIGTGAMCDPYMPCEDTLRLTRRCLEIILRYGFGATLQTKSDRVLRDLDLLCAINESAKCVVQMTLTTRDNALCGIIEPNVCPTSRRVETLRVLRAHGIPTVVWLSPILPFLNDTEENVRGLLRDCADAGVRGIICYGMGVTLREGDREYFYAALDRHFSGMRAKYEQKYGNAYEVLSPRNDALMAIFHAECERAGMLHDNDRVFSYLREYPARAEQLSFF